MKLPCKVVEDLLPMYVDCLCSDDTAELVEEHLRECPGCREMLVQMQTEIVVAESTIDDTKPLAALQKKWQKSKWVFFRNGICVILASFVLIIAVLAGTWYFGRGKRFLNMAKDMERTTNDGVTIVSSDYMLEKDGYRFDLWIPGLWGNAGFARVDGKNGMGLFVYPEAGEKYSFKLYITNVDGRMWSVYLKADMTPDFDNYETLYSAEKEKEKVRLLVAEKNGEILEMLQSVYELWGIKLSEIGT